MSLASARSRPWIKLPVKSDKVYLLQAHFTAASYSVHVTDLDRIWGETLSAENVRRRAEEDKCVVDISAGEEQLTGLLDMLKDGLNGKEKDTSITLEEEEDELRFQLTLRQPGLTLHWSFSPTLLPPSTLISTLTIPLMSLVGYYRDDVLELSRLIAEKDKHIAAMKEWLTENNLTYFPRRSKASFQPMDRPEFVKKRREDARAKDAEADEVIDTWTLAVNDKAGDSIEGDGLLGDWEAVVGGLRSWGQKKEDNKPKMKKMQTTDSQVNAFENIERPRRGSTHVDTKMEDGALSQPTLSSTRRHALQADLMDTTPSPSLPHPAPTATEPVEGFPFSRPTMKPTSSTTTIQSFRMSSPPPERAASPPTSLPPTPKLNQGRVKNVIGGSQRRTQDAGVPESSQVLGTQELKREPLTPLLPALEEMETDDDLTLPTTLRIPPEDAKELEEMRKEAEAKVEEDPEAKKLRKRKELERELEMKKAYAKKKPRRF
ncbi:hypothetical protein G7K_4333-t1 [Saitoella complicata NRRL Y-17804]|uniref:Non-homologous end-joining factor 1 n=2 Tax=Saitoella complicata (strain BCRC 22490 / CBS 7301 / JCM 7358 / NBRC 10748 / NRRL Y-17804) TaxID=698492 RepID=A0A0E9NK31_SAICN|nr:hypothetical protein G7K_4333-t1 [Saitoella complicata NRRL Y-17804]